MTDACAEPELAALDAHAVLSMSKRGWTAQEIREAYDLGASFPASDLAAGGAPATRFVHPTTGKSVIINNATGRIIHVGGTGFQC